MAESIWNSERIYKWRLLTAIQISLRNKPYANHITALNVRKNDKLNGINSTLLVRITCAYKNERKVKCLWVVFFKNFKILNLQKNNNKREYPNLLSSNSLIILLTTMLKGAAKTLTETVTQTHPKNSTRNFSFTAKCVTRRIKVNKPMFIETNTLRVEFCSQNSTLIKLEHIYNWVNKII